MIKRAVQTTALVFAVSAPMWLGLQGPGASQSSIGPAHSRALAQPSAESTQATAAKVMAAQSVWDVMALSTR